MPEMAENQSSFWAKHSRGNGSFLDKEALAESGEAFRVLNVRTGSGQYGPQWYVVVDRGNPDGLPDGTEEIVSFPRTDNREELFKDLKQALNEGEVIHAKIRSFVNKRGQTGYDLAPVEDDHMEEVPF